MKYKILSHTADLRLEVYGKTIEELFKNAAEALADIQKKGAVGRELKERIAVEAASQSALLVDFLNDILAKSQINKAVYRVDSLDFAGNKLTAKISGAKVEKFDEDVKAVTYHEADVKKDGDLFTAKLVLDI